MTNKEKSIAFSNGEFENIYHFIADNAVWIIIEDHIYTGKSAIIDHCDKVQAYFKSVTTKFETTNVIEELNQVAVNGTAQFIDEGKLNSFIYACDLYEFNDKGEIEKITSYCIEKK